MNLPDFKVVLQKLSVIKNNKSLLMSIIIAFVALLLLIPTQLLSSRLKTKIEKESITNGARQVDSLANWVQTNSISTAETQRLEAHSQDANNILNLVIQTTQRELLSYDVFPEPDPNGYSPQVFQVFGQRYRKSIEDLIDRHNGGDCPSAVELQRRMEESAASLQMSTMNSGGRGGTMGMGFETPMMEMGMGRGGPYGGGAPMMGMGGRGSMGGMTGGTVTYGSELERTIVDEICRGRASNVSVYVNPQDLSGYDFWANYKYDVVKEDGVEDCWYFQLAHWVIDDVFQTVEKMNSGHENVLTAPIKRIMNVSFVPNIMGFGGGGVYGGMAMGRMGGQSQNQSGRPEYVLSASDGLAESCTGRFSEPTSEIDVIHFNLVVVVDAKSVLPFIQELCSSKDHIFRGYPDGQETPQNCIHNQITVIESKMGSVVPDDYLHAYYRYGEKPAVELELVCEYIFDREGYAPIKPEMVKQTLSGEETQ